MTVLHVVFRVGDGEYVLPASEVLHMESFTGATTVPGAAAHVAGLVQVRGRVVPVVDLRMRFGLPRVTPTIDSRVLIVEHGTRVVGLLADAAREIVRLNPDDLRPPPELVVEQAAGYVTHVVEVGKRLLMRIDSTRVIGEESPDGQRS
ncbi:MAG TPA: chemotaxis protein CheW [Polyangiales bacterium]|nr:chemotaxis protein CheW [Polyangiales bacterium]